MSPPTFNCISDAIPDLTGRLIDHESLELVELLGSGAYGVVYRAVETTPSTSSNPREFAVKVLVRFNFGHEQAKAQHREINLHSKVSSHPNIIAIDRIVKDDENYIFVVMDFCRAGDMCNAIIERQIYYRDDALVKQVFTQLIDAVEYCHDRGVYHRDLKPDNILCSADGSQVYVADFGCSTSRHATGESQMGTSSFMSPPHFYKDRSEMSFSSSDSDVWALGIILINMLSASSPWSYASLDDPYFSRFVFEPDYLLQTMPISRQANYLLRRILAYKTYSRISLSELRQEVAKVETFFMTDNEVRGAPMSVRKLDMRCRNIYENGVRERERARVEKSDVPALTQESSDSGSECSEAITPETHPVQPDIEIVEALDELALGGSVVEAPVPVSHSKDSRTVWRSKVQAQSDTCSSMDSDNAWILV
ncbi:hypothetical protein EW146_g7089 [Bondarzewia mesenterica]|uniref:Protein kinase domain-containing protein n=1 Tax=Bondarzewia mesenterica TaxID=1095465 RepID=A0A4S4LLR4_9AGAM|nr:hypothetical protein EW146_g7089 [Bondarzewia mesenterica]